MIESASEEGPVESVKSANLALRFLLELAALAALFYWGYQRGDSTAAKWALAIAAPAAMAILWWLFVAPKARIKIPSFPKFVVGIAILVVAAVALNDAGYPGLAIAFEILIAINAVLLIILEQ
jgi:hypothetical protein